MSEAPAHTEKMAPVWAGLPTGVVDGGEVVLLAIKPSAWKPVLSSLAPLAIGCSLAIGAGLLNASIPGMSVAATAQMFLLLAMVPLGIGVVRWVPTWYVLTNRRVMIVQGVREARIRSCLLVDVRNTYINADVAERLLKLGTISFVSNDTKELPSHWQSIAQPAEVHEKIRRAVENAIDQHCAS